MSSSIDAGKTAAMESGGIGWPGSLVGTNNHSNLGYRYSTPQKRYKYSGSNEDSAAKELPSSIVVQFSNRDGEEVGGKMDVPMSSDSDQMSALVHSLLHQNDDSEDMNQVTPYSFYAKIKQKDEKTGREYHDSVEVVGSLTDLISHHSVSTEAILSLTFHPLSIFKVRPVTRCTDTMPGHTEAVLHVSFSPDSKHLASGGGDTTVRFWDVNTNLPRKTCTDHKNHVLCTSWSPDAKRFASADKNGVLITWDPIRGTHLAKIKAHSKYITDMAWEPLHRNASCERLATSAKDCLVKLWNVRTKQCLVTLSGHTDSVEAIKWGGEGFLYSAARDRTIKMWRDNDGKLCRTFKGHAHRINTLALSCDYVCRTGPFEPKQSSSSNPLQSPQAAQQAALQRYQTFKSSIEPERLVSGSDDFTLFLWHPIDTKHPIKRLTGHQQLVNDIAFSPDGRYFASASFDKKIKLWNGKSGEFLMTFMGHVGAVYKVAWSLDSRFLVSGSKDGTAKLWEVQKGKCARETLAGHADEIYALDWSPNGACVATGSKDRTIKIWKH